MPQARHYDNILLDNCYLYTFDEKYKQTVMQELGRNAYDTKVIFLKNEYKNFSLKKVMFDSTFDGFDERQTFNILHQYYIDKYKLTTHKKNNKTIKKVQPIRSNDSSLLQLTDILIGALVYYNNFPTNTNKNKELVLNEIINNTKIKDTTEFLLIQMPDWEKRKKTT